jgi:hypothetical protein
VHLLKCPSVPRRSSDFNDEINQVPAPFDLTADSNKIVAVKGIKSQIRCCDLRFVKPPEVREKRLIPMHLRLARCLSAIRIAHHPFVPFQTPPAAREHPLSGD